MPEPRGPVLVLHETDSEYEALSTAPGLELARVLTAAGTTGLGGGFARFRGEGELANWTVRYDETFFVLHPRDWDGTTTRRMAEPRACTRERRPSHTSDDPRQATPTIGGN